MPENEKCDMHIQPASTSSKTYALLSERQGWPDLTRPATTGLLSFRASVDEHIRVFPGRFEQTGCENKVYTLQVFPEILAVAFLS